MPNISDYKDRTDEELIELLRAGQVEVAEYLCIKYKDLVSKNIKHMFLKGAETEDLYQEGMIGLFKAIMGYRSDREASFYTFADLCIRRQLSTAIEATNRQKNIPLNSYLSIDNDGDEAMSSVFVTNEAEADMSFNPEKILIDREDKKIIEDNIRKLLTPFEIQVFELQKRGLGYVEIADKLNKGKKSIDNALQRIKTKIKSIDKIN